MKPLIAVAGMIGLMSAATVLRGQSLPSDDKLPTPPTGKTWKMIWNDEFDGAKLDEAKWETPPDGPRHDGWWMKKAVSLDGQGRLVIQTSRENDKIINGCVRTKGKFAHTFGYYVARVKLPREPGHWAAFWLFEGCHVEGDKWWNGTEIDIFEKFWPNDEVQHTLFWDAVGNRQLQQWHQTVTLPGIREGWHTFALWWTPEAYIYYVDGKETWRINPGRISQIPQYIKLSDETAKWCKDISKAQLPDQFRVDYVRVFDLVDQTSPGSTG